MSNENCEVELCDSWWAGVGNFYIQRTKTIAQSKSEVARENYRGLFSLPRVLEAKNVASIRAL
jgi:hypothetical protein